MAKAAPGFRHRRFGEIGDRAGDLPQVALARLGGRPHPQWRRIIAPGKTPIRTLVDAIGGDALDGTLTGKEIGARRHQPARRLVGGRHARIVDAQTVISGGDSRLAGADYRKCRRRDDPMAGKRDDYGREGGGWRPGEPASMTPDSVTSTPPAISLEPAVRRSALSRRPALSDLPRTIRGRPLASAGAGCRRYSSSCSPGWGFSIRTLWFHRDQHARRPEKPSAKAPPARDWRHELLLVMCASGRRDVLGVKQVLHLYGRR